MYRGYGLAQMAINAANNYHDAYYSDVVKYKEDGRKRETQYLIIQEDGGYTVQERVSHSSMLGRAFASSQSFYHSENLSEALEATRISLFATMEKKAGRIEYGRAPFTGQHNLLHMSEAEKSIKQENASDCGSKCADCGKCSLDLK